MKLAILFAPLLWLATACAPPAAHAPQETSTIEMAAAARTEMDRVNSARLMALPQHPPAARATVPDAPAPDPAAGGVEVTPAVTVSYDAGLARVQVLLDRAHMSPGVIDGYDGENVRKAVRAYQDANALPATGVADDALLARLEQADSSPALVSYVVTQQDVAGPFNETPDDLEAMSQLERLGYANAVEALAEKFHMDEDLLRTLNPGVDFNQVGAEIAVANVGGGLDAAVASILVDKAAGAVRAYDAAGQMIGFYPASIGSSEARSPSGDHTVTAIAFNPTYHYDPSRLPTFGARDHGALSIPAGPNSPVGSVWIDLSTDTYGIHGAPQPQLVSKSQSHGCVRLTNWDAEELAHAVSRGVPVRFVERATATLPTERG